VLLQHRRYLCSTCLSCSRLGIIKMELGLFAHETSEQIRDRQLRMQKCYTMVVVTLAVLGVLAWVVSMGIAVVI
jgi:hypothetical protein